MEDLTILDKRLNSLMIFQNLLNDEVLKPFKKLITDINQGRLNDALTSYSLFASKLFENNYNFSEYLLNLVLDSENIYIIKKGNSEYIDKILDKSLKYELGVFQKLSAITSEIFIEILGEDVFIPSWYNSDYDFERLYFERLQNVAQYGYGVFAKHHIFSIKDGNIIPVKSPDTIRFSRLSGYERERGEVISNTLALIKGKPASNVLLYGDCGTGKSATVKACANEFRDMGLRLIELKKSQINEIPNIIEVINRSPLKFILFIDDLSFSENDDNYASLKALLEGSVSVASDNSVIYATSNRRHLIKENFSQRDGDDIHFNDTLSELLSLSDRFGLTVSFTTPNKALYLKVVEALANEYEIRVPLELLFAQAETFALRKGGRSPRTAKHFIEHIKSLEE